MAKTSHEEIFSSLKNKSLIPTLPRFVLFLGRHTGRIFLIGFLIFSLCGVAIFYLFGYRFTQQAYTSNIHLLGVSRTLLDQAFGRLQGQQSKTKSAPATNPFE